jgi:outer membrane protein
VSRLLKALISVPLLLCPSLLQAEQQDASTTVQAPLSIDTLVNNLLEQGKADEADRIVATLLEETPSHPQLRFLSGLVAMNRNETQRAIRIFRSILIDHPKAQRVRLELARAFFVAKDYGNAARQFQFALAGHPPEAVRANINRYLYAIRQAKSLSYNLEVSLAPDTNLNSGSSSREVTLYGLPFQLSDDAQQHSGVGLELNTSGEWAPRLSATTRLRLGASVQRKEYSGARFDDMTVAVYAGPRFVTPRWDFSILATANKRWFGAKPYNLAVGGRISATYYANPRLGLTTDIAMQSVNYDQATYMTGSLASLGESAIYALTPSSGVSAKMGGSRQTARVKAYSNWGGYLAVGYFRDLPAGFSAFVETSLARVGYDAPLAAFETKRVDRSSTAMLNILNRRLVLSRFTPRITYTFTRQRSNITLYSFNRNRVEMGLTTTF